MCHITTKVLTYIPFIAVTSNLPQARKHYHSLEHNHYHNSILFYIPWCMVPFGRSSYMLLDSFHMFLGACLYQGIQVLWLYHENKKYTWVSNLSYNWESVCLSGCMSVSVCLSLTVCLSVQGFEKINARPGNGLA